VKEQAVRLRFNRLLDLWAERSEQPQASQLVNSHPQIEHHKIGIYGEIDRWPLDSSAFHARLTRFSASILYAYCQRIAAASARQSDGEPDLANFILSASIEWLFCIQDGSHTIIIISPVGFNSIGGQE
jgi:hypothetical protein